jgi:hypothetical protein
MVGAYMTQAIAAVQILECQGDEVIAVIIGTNSTRTIPESSAGRSGTR